MKAVWGLWMLFKFGGSWVQTKASGGCMRARRLID